MSMQLQAKYDKNNTANKKKNHHDKDKFVEDELWL